MGRRRRAQPNSMSVVSAYDDARQLALEIAGARGPVIDPMFAGIVLDPGEVARRVVPGALTMWVDRVWAAPSSVEILLTDRRVLVRFRTGALISWWWARLVGFSPELHHELHHDRVVLDFGDGRPRAVSGPGVAAISVAGVAALYGPSALLTHPALAGLRQGTLAAGLETPR